MSKGKRIGLAILLGATIALPASAATPPSISNLPVVSASTLIADDTTQYTVTMTARDVDGYNNLRCMRVLFNYTESGGDPSQGRGQMVWGRTDADVTQYGGTWVIADATGGGRWGYRTDAWGAGVYCTPLACATTTSGEATGGTGFRTVTWTFTVKAAWAFNPVMNDADAWVADGEIGGTTYAIGWIDGEAPFDVVPAPCAQTCATQPPVLSYPTTGTIAVTINPADSATDLYAIMIAPSLGGKMFVQADGSLGTAPRWHARGTKTVTGLLPRTTYTFCVRASRSEAGWCPSAWGPTSEATTAGELPVIDVRNGTPFSPWVRGQCPYRSIYTAKYGPVWDLCIGSMGRGLAGGLDADCYDWRDIDSGSGWGTPTGSGRFTTLEFLQYARDHNVVPLITANAFGGGYRDWANPTYPGVFVCQTVNPGGLAADWVRYTNFILRTYRQGDEGGMTADDLRIYNSITNWGGKAKLLAPGEGLVPMVQYWEIGNEPELGGFGDFLSDHYLSPADYRDRYKLISTAMKAVDPTLKFGPCLMTPTDPNSGSGLWLAALAADPAAPIDFVGYHSYYGSIKGNWGFLEGMATALRDYKAFLNSKSAGIRSIMNQYGRANCGLIASEWNPVNWDAPGSLQASMANAIGVVETCFTWAEDGVLAGNFWEQPQDKLGVVGAFAGLVEHMGDVLIATGTQMGYPPANCNFRIYITKNQGDNTRIMIWGLNFDDAQPVTVNLGLVACRVLEARLRHYGKPGTDAAGGDTSLTTATGMAWDEQDVTAGFNPASFAFTMEDAEITLLVLTIRPVTDYDRDGDVDLDDFGTFQYCFTGPNRPLRDPGCDICDHDGDADVDLIDFGVFQSCFNGPNRPYACL